MPSDVSDLLGSDFDAAAEARVDRLLDSAEAIVATEIPGICFEELDLTASPFLTVDGECSQTLVLPYRPVQTITSVTVDGFELEPWQYTATARGELIRRDGCTWGTEASEIVIAGKFGPTGGDITWVVADLVRQTLANPGGLISETIGARSAMFSSDTKPMQLSDSHKRRINRYRIAVVSAGLG